MSASTLSTHTGRPAAKQRAQDSWAIWHDEDTARHNRMMQALRRIESAAPVVSDVPADPYRWRREWLTEGREANARTRERIDCINARLVRLRCTHCRGTGAITLHDGHGGVDFDYCPACTPMSGSNTYPTADDGMEVQF